MHKLIEFYDDVVSSLDAAPLKQRFLQWVVFVSVAAVMRVVIRREVDHVWDESLDSALARNEAVYTWAFESLPATLSVLERNAMGQWEHRAVPKASWRFEVIERAWLFFGVGVTGSEDVKLATLRADGAEFLKKLGLSVGVQAGNTLRASKEAARKGAVVAEKDAILKATVASTRALTKGDDYARMAGEFHTEVGAREMATAAEKAYGKLEAWANGAASRAMSTFNSIWAAEAASEAGAWVPAMAHALKVAKSARDEAEESIGAISAEPMDASAQMDAEAAFIKRLSVG